MSGNLYCRVGLILKYKLESNVSMDSKLCSFKQLNHSKNNEDPKNKAFLFKQQENKTSTPLRKQVFSSSQTESLHSKTLIFNQKKPFFSDSLDIPFKCLPAQEKADFVFSSMKENIEMNVIRSPFRAMEKKDQAIILKGSQTPTQRSNTESVLTNDKFKKKHRKQLSSQFQTLTEVEEAVSFKQMIQNRRKIPTNQLATYKIHENSQIITMSSYHNILEKEQSQDLFYSQYHEERKRSRKESELIRCKNNDGKIAKYKVISKQSIEDDLLYCPRCTISLVQQGFILEEIEHKQRQAQQKEDKLKKSLQSKRSDAALFLIKLHKRQKVDLNLIKSYYNELIKSISRCQEEDISLIQDYYLKREDEIVTKIQKIDTLLGSISLKNNQNQLRMGVKEVMVQLKSQQEGIMKSFRINLEMTGIFDNIFEEQFRPNLQVFNTSFKEYQKKTIEHQSTSTNLLQSLDKNSALRFSFEKELELGGKKIKMQSLANLQGQSEAVSVPDKLNANSCESPAFRNIFPQQEESVQISTDISSPTFKNI